VEIKSMSGYSYKRFIEEGLNDSWGYLGQVNVYMKQLLLDDKIDQPGETIYIAVNKDNLQITERILSYNPEYAHMADENFEKIAACIREKKQPARPILYEETKKGQKPVRGELHRDNSLPIVCSYCDYKYTCWTEPKQIVEFCDGMPMYPTSPTAYLRLEYKKDRWGGSKPIYKLVGA
jgi:hypothetical protein